MHAIVGQYIKAHPPQEIDEFAANTQSCRGKYDGVHVVIKGLVQDVSHVKRGREEPCITAVIPVGQLQPVNRAFIFGVGEVIQIAQDVGTILHSAFEFVDHFILIGKAFVGQPFEPVCQVLQTPPQGGCGFHQGLKGFAQCLKSVFVGFKPNLFGVGIVFATLLFPLHFGQSFKKKLGFEIKIFCSIHALGDATFKR